MKKLEKANLLKKGCVIVGDNILYPGAPDYKKYMKESPLYKSVVHETNLGFSLKKPDEVMVSVFLGK